MKICMINGSPKHKNSCSEYLIDEFIKLLDEKNEVVVYSANNKISNDELDNMYCCEVIVFVFPLYVDAIPSHLISFLELFQTYLNLKPKKNTHIYAMANCGFFEGEQNKYALKIIENYCENIGFIWGCGIGIGAGAFVNSSRSMPWQSSMKKPIYDSLLILKNSIEKEQHTNENIFVTANMPRRLYILEGHKGWRLAAKKNNLKEQELYNN